MKSLPLAMSAAALAALLLTAAQPQASPAPDVRDMRGGGGGCIYFRCAMSESWIEINNDSPTTAFYAKYSAKQAKCPGVLQINESQIGTPGTIICADCQKNICKPTGGAQIQFQAFQFAPKSPPGFCTTSSISQPDDENCVTQQSVGNSYLSQVLAETGWPVGQVTNRVPIGCNSCDPEAPGDCDEEKKN